jgi:hypothetical protein
MPAICSRCKTRRNNDDFINPQGKVLKTCVACRTRGGRKQAKQEPEYDDEQQYYAEPAPAQNTYAYESESDSDSDSDSGSDSSEDGIYCKYCNKTFPDEASARKHANTKSHQRNMGQ